MTFDYDKSSRLIVGGRSSVGASRRGVIATSHRLVVSVVVEGPTSSSAVRGSNGRASHVCVVAWAVITSTRSESSVTSGRGGRDSSDFGITELGVALLTLPKLVASATSVVVSGAGAEALLLLVVTAHEELHRDGQKEEEGSNDSNSETSSVEPTDGTERGSVGDLITLTVTAKALTGRRGAIAKGSLNDASATGCSIAGENSDGDHSTAAKGVEDQAEESEEGLAAQAACKDDGEDGVQHSHTREALDGLLPAGNSDIAVSLDSKEVRVDSKNDCSAAKLKGVERRSNELQGSTTESHFERLNVDRRRRGRINWLKVLTGD